MNIDEFLTPGSQVRGEKSPLQRKRELQQRGKNQKDSVLARVIEIGFQATVDEFQLSETALAKVCAPLIRKGDLQLDTLYSGLPIQDVEEYIYGMNTTSIKRLVQGGRYSEAVLRLVKAHIEGKQRESYGEE